MADASAIPAPERAVDSRAGSPAGDGGRPWRLRTLLVCLALATILPLVALSGILAVRDAQGERAKTEALLLNTARSLRGALDREMQTAITALETLRHNGHLARDDIDAFAEVARRVRADHPHWISVILTRPDGQQVMNLAARPGQPLPNIAHYEVIQAVIRTKRPAISELLFGQVGRVHLVGIDVPVLDATGELKYVLGLSMPASHLRAVIQDGLPEAWSAAIVDYKNVIVARSRLHDESVGKPGNALLGQMGGASEAVLEGTSREGAGMVTAVARSALSGWGVAVAVPTAVLDAPLHDSLALLAVGAALLLAFSIGAALLIGWRIARPLERLAASAGAVLRGDVPARDRAAIREVRALASALAEAGAAERAAQERSHAAEGALRQAQRLEAVGQLTAGVAHDFNNLLTAVIGNLDLLERNPGDPRNERRLRAMREAAERGARLTAQLLAFSRRQRLDPRPVDLDQVVAGMTDLLRSSIGGTVQVDTALGRDLWPALVDPTQIELVILNLAVNARDAMPVGGRILIETANVTLGPPSRSEEPAHAGDYVLISVSDTGTGMSEEVRARAFEPFFTTKDVGQGSGLGLSQVFGVAKQLGGGVRIDTRLGEGTTVGVYLPRATGSREAGLVGGGDAADEALVATERLGGVRVLLVDDDAQVRQVTATMLEEFGCVVIEAGSGRAALERASQTEHGAGRPLDLALLDFAMPGMNGVEVAHALQARWPSLPIVFVTGFADAAALKGLGQARVVQKPFRRGELARTLLAALATDATRAGSNVVPLRSAAGASPSRP